jgi:DNA replication protein DnaC
MVFGRWDEILDGDVAGTMIDRLKDHADIIALKGDSYRVRTDLDLIPASDATDE